MSRFVRVEVFDKNLTNEEHIVQNVSREYNLNLKNIFLGKVYYLEVDEIVQNNQLSNVIETILRDIHTEDLFWNESIESPQVQYDLVIETMFKPGVTDNAAKAANEAVDLVFPEYAGKINIYTGVIYLIEGDLNLTQASELTHEIFGNPLLQSFKILPKIEFEKENRFHSFHVPKVKIDQKSCYEINLNINDQEFEKLNTKNCWALSKDEFNQIKDYYKSSINNEYRAKKGLSNNPTDVELEVIAQSWSEHCKHKIFAANITYTESENTKQKIGDHKINSLYKSYIKKTTKDLVESKKVDWLVSVFSDNAGIINFDKNINVCAKVETHNSPSALDPYGGALTGILGVNRDIIGCGLGSKPIANTDVFCFANPNMLNKNIQLPIGLKHPKTIFEGVHKGVEDGGNKSGIPTVNGAIYFNDHYAGKPLVYCGTIGTIPKCNTTYDDLSTKNQSPGDYIVIAGGRIGADGIHGATFSSLELNENSPATAVQIGDPITQKRLLDFTISARDKGLFTSITDNGAGGLSSSVGEMAVETNGAFIDLALAPVKYPGLSPFELMISESQERMTFAVSPEKYEEFIKLAKQYGVEATSIGHFTKSGYLEVNYQKECVCCLDLKFLHESLRPMELKAHFDGEKSYKDYIAWHGQSEKISINKEELTNKLDEIIPQLLRHPNIASKEFWVKQYDHEVKATTVVKPFNGKTQKGPSDAGVIWLKPHGGEENNAITISCGMAPHLSHYDTYLMTEHSIDEAVRNAVATGVNPEKVSLLDNYCWPDPIKGKNNPDYAHKMAQLVRSCQALYDTGIEYGMPFISGKDSMKNDFIGKLPNQEQIKISIPPTLLVTAVGQLPDVEKTVESSFKSVGMGIYYIGDKIENEVRASHLTDIYKIKDTDPTPCLMNRNENINRYKKIYQLNQTRTFQSMHDISDGGAITCIIESCFGNLIGAEVNLNNLKSTELAAFLFNEPTGSFIATASLKNKEYLKKELGAILIGTTTKDKNIIIKHREQTLFEEKVTNLLDVWRNHPASHNNKVNFTGAIHE